MTANTPVSKKTKAFLLGTAAYPKDEQLQDIPNIAHNLQALTEALTKPEAIGIPESEVTQLLNIKDNTKIKEELAKVAEKAKEGLIVYLSGYFIHRKGHLYLASSGSSRSKIHLNGISFDEIIDILGEAEVKHKTLFLDACFLDSKEEELDEEATIELLKNYDNNEENICLISASPGMGFQAFLGYTENTIFTQALTEVLRVGMPLEAATLTLANVKQGIASYLSEQGLRFPPLGMHSAQESIVFCNNTRYTAFQNLKTEADRFFDEGIYQEALKSYKLAAELLPANKEVDQKRKFIRLLLKGIASGDQRLEAAKDAFIEAQQLLDIPIIREKIVETLLAIASKHFQLENFEEAKEQYKAILGWQPNHEFAQQRLTACAAEISFLDYMEEADRLYFDDSFVEALKFYEKALEIHPDRKAQRRKAECERLLEKEAQLREKLAQEIKAEEAGKVAQKAQEVKVDELRAQITEELKPQIEERLRKELRSEVSKEVQADFQKEVELQAELKAKQLLEGEKKALKKEASKDFEEDFWTNALLTNQLEVYKFYLQFFPRPKYTEKAKSRIKDLKRQEEEERKRRAAIAHPAPEKEDTTEVETPQDSSAQSEPNVEKSQTPKTETPQEVLNRLEASFNGHHSEAKKEVSHKREEEKKAESKAEKEDEKTSEPETPSPIAEEVTNAITEELSKEVEPDPEPSKEEEEEEVTLTEEQLWDKAQSENTLDGYQYYVDKTNDATHLVDAYYQINRLSKAQKEQEANEELNTSSTSSDYNDTPSPQKAEVVKPEPAEEKPVEVKPTESKPVKETPSYTHEEEEEGHSPYFRAHGSDKPEIEEEEEDRGTASAEEQRLWDATIRDNTISSYYDYISQSRDKYFLPEAKARIQQLKGQAKKSEEMDWEEAYSSNSVEALKGYIRKYPLGDFYAKAMFRISELEAGK